MITANSNGLLEGEEADIRKEVRAVVPDPDRWLNLPNDQLGGLEPEKFIGTPQEEELRHLVRAIKHGIPT